MLFNYLFARHHNGTYIVRLEDTDQERLVPEAAERLVEGMRWLGLLPDEGYGSNPGGVDKGDFGPYTQSDRRAIYQEWAEKLVADGKAYYCFATKEELAEMRAKCEAEKRPPRYNGQYRDFDPAEAAKRVAAGEPHVIRLKMPQTGEVVGQDLVYGDVKFNYAEYDDHVIMKSDGLPTYHLASVVDDHLMEISHVFRGEEWMPSWPRHLACYEAFGWTPPEFLHLPVILGRDKQKLSKRHGAKFVLQYREEGYLPEAILNFIAFLGWNPKTTQEFFLLDELAGAFDAPGINKSNPVFDGDRLDFMNGRYLRELTPTQIVARLSAELTAAGAPVADNLPQVEAAVATVRDRAKRLADIPSFISFYFVRPTVDAQLLPWKEQDPAECRRLLEFALGGFQELAADDWQTESIQQMLNSRVEHADCRPGEMLWPVRVALSGLAASPSPFEIAAVLGPEESLARLTAAIATLSS
jgi:glutamyl-tRNA synthetase